MCMLCAVIACNRESEEYHNDTGSSLTEEQALSAFAQTLSKAVFESEEIRVCLKNEALKQIDKDYDVFYPVVKDQILDNGKTFRETLLNYTDEKELLEIESRLPLLTIYVPDMRWLGTEEFYPDIWDTSLPYVLTTYKYNGQCKYLFAEGFKVDELSCGVFPDKPTLIIKNNERIKCSTVGKSTNVTYQFIDPVFNGLQSKYNHPFTPEVSYWEFDTEDVSNYIDADTLSHISPLAVTAYETLLPYANVSSQKDYCYYGMTSPDSKGVLNINVIDRLFRFRIKKEAFSTISDDFIKTNGSQDPQTQVVEIADVDGGPYDENEVLSRIWSDGVFEIGLYIMYGNNANSIRTIEKYISARPQDLFQIKRIKKEYWHSTWVKWYRNWRYTVNIDDIESKWYYPESMDLVDWDLLEGHSDVTYRFFEVDSGDESNESETISFKYVINLNQTFDTSNDNHKTQLGLSGNCEYQDTQSISLKWKQENEKLGDVVVDYNTPYILGKDSNNKYQLNPLSSNNIIINILPYYEVK